MVSKRLLKISKLNPNYQVSFKKKIIKYLHHFCSKDLLREKQNLNNKPVSFIIKNLTMENAIQHPGQLKFKI